MGFAWTIVALVVVLAVAWRFLGSYLVSVYEGRTRWLSVIERPIYRLIGVDPQAEQTWQRYAASVIVFSGVALAATYGIFRLQGSLPFNPQHLPAVPPALSWNTSVSFVTNTNWQAYSGESTMSYLSQMGALAVQNFLSAAVGIAVAVALIRGFARKGAKTVGNFWVDLVLGTIYVLGGISLVIGPGTRSILNPGMHGLTEVTYAFASVAQNNGSAFAGLAANTPWYDTSLGLVMLVGRFVPIVLALAIAGSLAGARAHARTRATLDTSGPTFVVFLLGVILIVGGLIYFPMLILGPIGERIVG